MRSGESAHDLKFVGLLFGPEVGRLGELTAGPEVGLFPDGLLFGPEVGKLGEFPAGPEVGEFPTLAGPPVGLFPAGPDVGLFPAGPEVGLFPAGPPVGAEFGDELGPEVGLRLFGVEVGSSSSGSSGLSTVLSSSGSSLPRTMFILQKMDRNNTRSRLSFIVRKSTRRWQ